MNEMTIAGPRVKCANCGMIYTQLPPPGPYWIGVPLKLEGAGNCPGCGSNAYDETGQPSRTIATDTTNFAQLDKGKIIAPN